MRGKRKMESARAGSAVETQKTPFILSLDDNRAAGASGGLGSPRLPSVRKKRVTIAEIARHAGVSPSTVSITLADRRDIAIAEATRERVKSCASELGYYPSRLGKGFLHGRSRLIGVLTLSDSYLPFLACMAGIQKGLSEADYIPLVLSKSWLGGFVRDGDAAVRDGADELPDLRRLLEYQVDGVLYFSLDAAHTSACVGDLLRRKIPTVVLGGVDPRVGDVDVVGGDNEMIGRIAAEHLLAAGCSSFAFGKSISSHPSDDVIYSSFASRLKAAGYACGDFTMDVAKPGDPDRLLSRLVKPPAGVFAVREEIAALMMRAAFSLGWWVPRDFALIGMGRSELSRFNALPVTTVNRNSAAAGEAAAELLIRRIEGFAGNPQRVLIPPSLMVRSSSVSDVSRLLCSE